MTYLESAIFESMTFYDLHLPSGLIRFALGNNINQEASTYEISSRNQEELTKEIEQTIKTGASPKRIRQIEEELHECSAKAEQAQTFRTSLHKVHDAFNSLDDSEKQVFNKRLGKQGKDFELVLRDRTSGKLLALRS